VKVSALRPDRRIPGYIVVEVDGARFASLPAEQIEKLHLVADRELSPEEVERLEYVADVEAARRVALRMLSARPCGVQEVLLKLRQRGHNPSAVAEAVGRLEASGLLDDRQFAQHFARIRSAKGHGRSRLLTDLLRRGVDRRTAESAIDQVLEAEEVDEEAQIRALAEKRLSQLGDLKRDVKLRRVVGYLARRGYRGGAVVEVVKELLE